jgi:predicted  nucleic acid-binding Zn ribbon protein
MYLAELRFTLIADTKLGVAEQAIRRYLEALIFNGQMLGREFPTAFTGDAFCSRLVLPTLDALNGQHASSRVKAAEQQLAAAGLGYPQCQVLGQDLMSQQTAATLPDELVLFTTYADTCSPLRCATTLQPVPLFWLLSGTTDHEALIRWQLQFQALDEIQLQQTRVLQKTAENSLQQFHSKLNRQGRKLAAQLARQNQRPIWYALYSGSSKDCQAEADKCCPGCGGNWRLATPQAGVFDFRCDNCLLLSNIAWECQSNSGE